MAPFRCNNCSCVYEDHYPPDDTCIKCKKGTIQIIQPKEARPMTAIKPAIKLFTSQEDETKGIHINSLILEYNGNNYHLPGGTNDTIHVFTQSIAIYVLSINKGNGTMGLNAFMAPESDPINTVYMHTPQDIKDILGPKWELLSPKVITTKLINYLI